MTRLTRFSSPQMAIWHTEQVFPGTSFGNNVCTVRLSGEINYTILESAINASVMKNDGIRIHIINQDGEPMQYISEYKPLKVDFFDFSQQGEAGFEEFIRTRSLLPFKLIDTDLFYFATFKINDEKGGIYINLHHLISDAWAMGKLVSRIMEDYSKLKHGIDISTQNEPSYLDFISRENTYYESERFINSRKFWENKFETIPELTELKPRIDGLGELKAETKCFNLSKELTLKLRNYCKDTGVSPFIVFLSALSIDLYRISGKQDMVIGAAVLNRSNFMEKAIIGMFSGVIPMHLLINPELSFDLYTAAISEEWMSYLRNQKYPYNLILKGYRERHKVTGNLFDISVSYQNITVDKTELTGDYHVDWHFNGYQTEALQVTVSDWENEGQYQLRFNYRVDLVSPEEIEKMSSRLTIILSDVMNNSSKKLYEVELLSTEEKNRLLYDFNATDAVYSKNKTLNQLFEEQVNRIPDNIAVVYENQSITYNELNRKSNQLAGLLVQKGVKPNKIVAVITERSIEMMTAILGILKAGGAYLPISPDYPEERIKFMLEDSKADIVLTQAHLIRKLNIESTVVDLDDKELYMGDGENLPRINSSGDLAYVIYTSGSTGKPKGAMIEHHSVVNRIQWMQKKYPIGKEDIILQKTPYTFDVSVWELFWWYFYGSKLCFLKQGWEKFPDEIVNAVEKNKITVMHFVPSMLNAFLEYVEKYGNSNRLRSLRHVFASGEALNPEQVKRFNSLLYEDYGIELHNLYGPTEATVDVTYFDCSTGKELKKIPIGKPIDNIKMFILDKNQRLLPEEVPGELHIAGVGLARGYLNRPELTKEKFVPCPFFQGMLMYKTGDLAAWMPDGNIEYLGRLDHQVKIRGMRIETGEIEYHLLQLPFIKEAVVIDRKDGNGNVYLCAYAVAEKDFTVQEIKEYMVKRLPDYMVPRFYVRINKMPLLSNGKLDRKALPEPDKLTDMAEFREPQNFVEETLVAIWCDVLDIDRVGTNHDFFEIGGDSLQAINAVAEIQKRLNFSITVEEMFKYRTIGEMANALISKGEAEEFKAIPKVINSKCAEVSSAQKRMFILNQGNTNSISYNMPGAITIEGELDTEKLKDALYELVKRHESFRTSFGMVNGRLMQIIEEEAFPEIPEQTCDEAMFEELCSEFPTPFDLGKAPILKALIVKLADNKHVLLIDTHHIVSDGISIEILFKELFDLYNGNELPPLTIQYKDFAYWHNRFLNSEVIKKREKYWLDTLSGELPVLDISSDYNRPSVQSFEGGKVRFRVDRLVANALNDLAKSTGATLYMILLAAYNVLLFKYTGQEDIIVGIPVAGRNHSDLKGIIGVFINSLAMRNYPAGNKTFESFLREVKENSIKAYANQDYPLEILLEKLDVKRDTGRNPLFDTMFALQNRKITPMESETARFTLSELDTNMSKFDFSLQACGEDEEIAFCFEYCSKLFKEDTIVRMAGHFLNILKDIASDAKKLISDIDMLSEDEKKQIFFEFNNTAADYPMEKTVYQLFEEQALKRPDDIAVICGDNTITYKELNEKASRLADKLREKGVRAESVVAVICNRSIGMVAGILAILKAGGVYLPVNPRYPEERIRFLIEDSSAVMIITNQKNTINTLHINCETIDPEDESVYINEEKGFTYTGKSSDPAYMIYTSGSSGTPKGVMVEHKSLVNFLFSLYNAFDNDIGAGDRCLSITNISFDVSICELFLPLAFGASLVLYEGNEYIDLLKLADTISGKEVTFTYIPPSILEDVYYQLKKSGSKIMLNKLLVGVEPIRSYVLDNYFSLNKDMKIINGYGPTETTICATFYRYMKNSIPERSYVPIGKPLRNTNIYIVDKYGNILPPGIKGEIYISGDCVARGYHNRKDLSAEKFVPCLYNKDKRMYKTGDLGKWLPDGNIEFMGRMDVQLKIAGNRIEPGEIENWMMSTLPVKRTVVVKIDDEDGNDYLCAYYISDAELDVSYVREQLKKKLPEYMIPSYYMRINEIPVTINGKLDKKALPVPNKNNLAVSNNILPANETEKKLIELCKKVLRIDRIGMTDNFFDLGGDSLAVMRVIAEAFQFGWNIEMQDFYNYRTLREISDKIRGEKNKEIENSVRYEEDFKKQGEPAVFYKTKVKRADVKKVLLTGATGYLGIHLLNELLSDEKLLVYCLVRADNRDEAEKKLNNALKYYFGDIYQVSVKNRIFTVWGDITAEKFGLPESEYKKLGSTVDTVIHTAALVKHYGDYSEFRKTNVNGTKEVISFCRQFDIRLNHISTLSVSGSSTGGNFLKSEFTENDFYIGQHYHKNVYVRSKYEAEKLVRESRRTGVNARVFRVGNLMPRYSDGLFQRNPGENIFYSLVRSIVLFGKVPDRLLKQIIDITPVDLCAKAVVKLLTGKTAGRQVFHIYNRNTITLGELIRQLNSFEAHIDIISDKEFDEFLLAISKGGGEKNFEKDLSSRIFLINSMQLNNDIAFNSELTCNLLQSNGFQWPTVDEKYIRKLMEGF